MLKVYFKSLVLMVSLFTLISCASLPTDISLSPELNLEKGAYRFTNTKAWQIDSQDLRVARHLIEIVDGNNVAQLINEQHSLRLLIESNLTRAWVSNQLNTSQASDYKVNIKLIKALATVTEATFSYEVESQMIIKIELSQQGNTFVKLFRSNKQWEAAFSTNAGDINKELNMQLSQLLNQILEDQDINTKLQQF